jgi:hypothetical protein
MLSSCAFTHSMSYTTVNHLSPNRKRAGREAEVKSKLRLPDPAVGVPVASGLHFQDDFQFDRRTERKARDTKDKAR